MSQRCLAGCCPHPHPERATVHAHPECPADVPGAELAERVVHLYACQGLSTYRIAAIVRISRQRVGRMLHESGVAVKPKGAGRRRPEPSQPSFPAPFIAGLYLREKLTCYQISVLTGIPARTIRNRLVRHGVAMRTRGRMNREDRLVVDPGSLVELYQSAGLSAAEVGRLLGVSRQVILRAAHENGLPVRTGGPPPRNGPSDIELIDALYADPDVKRALARFGMPVVPAGGPIWQRFPAPLAVTPDLVTELYISCGLTTTHIELLTGQPAASISRLLRLAGVTLRPAGGRSPFRRRWRTAAVMSRQAR